MEQTSKPVVLPRIIASLGFSGVLAVSAPLIWAAVAAGAGLVVLGGIFVVGTALLTVIPYLGQVMENRILRLRKDEARRAPIEQLQNFLQKKAEQVRAFRSAVNIISAQVMSLEGRLSDRKTQKPEGDYSKQEKALASMKEVNTNLVQKYRLAEQALVQLRDLIDDKNFEWQFAQAGAEAISSLNAASGQQLLDTILCDEAFSSVRDNFNRVCTDLEIEAGNLSNAKSLTFEGEVLDISGIRIPQMEKVT